MRSKRILNRLLFVSFGIQIGMASALAESMTFRIAGSDVRFCPEQCAFIQATGEITNQTPSDFVRFLEENEFYPSVIRLNSPGGSLQGGLALGELFLRYEFWTEIGSDEIDPSGERTFSGIPFTRRAPGSCASACAYAFLGGVRRIVLDGDRFGVHRFYQQKALEAPNEVLFTGKDLDDQQRIVGEIALYMVRMGVDAALLTLSDEAGPLDMRWLSHEEVRAYRVAYNPDEWKPWQIETFRQGIIAMSEKIDGSARMVASCTRSGGPQLVLINLRPGTVDWLKRCQDYTHPVLGENVPSTETEVLEFSNGGGIRFRLPSSTPRFGRPGLFEHGSVYPTACSANGWRGNATNMEDAVNVAFRNCFAD